ncbi:MULTISPECIES: hypothetical protein [unclassified Bacillus (in: firmicutes)]|nr:MULTISPECIES: hypothetical protein [unclassified Bacillus (in: firmicutes)]
MLNTKNEVVGLQYWNTSWRSYTGAVISGLEKLVYKKQLIVQQNY